MSPIFGSDDLDHPVNLRWISFPGSQYTSIPQDTVILPGISSSFKNTIANGNCAAADAAVCAEDRFFTDRLHPSTGCHVDPSYCQRILRGFIPGRLQHYPHGSRPGPWWKPLAQTSGQTAADLYIFPSRPDP